MTTTPLSKSRPCDPREAALVRLARALAPALTELARKPRLGQRYTWDCGCAFTYTPEGWEQRGTCGWHAGRWAAGPCPVSEAGEEARP